MGGGTACGEAGISTSFSLDLGLCVAGANEVRMRRGWNGNAGVCCDACIGVGGGAVRGDDLVADCGSLISIDVANEALTRRGWNDSCCELVLEDAFMGVGAIIAYGEG